MATDNGYRGKGGKFLPGCQPGPGRPKGSENIVSATSKAIKKLVIEHASEEITLEDGTSQPRIRWALDRLFAERPRDYVEAVQRVLPRELVIDDEDPPDWATVFLEAHAWERKQRLLAATGVAFCDPADGDGDGDGDVPALDDEPSETPLFPVCS